MLSAAGTFSLSQLKRPQPAAAEPAPEPEPPKGWLRPEPAADLLATPRRQKLLEHIWQRTSLSRQQFNELYLAPLQRYAKLVQQFPASESHHHAYPGGMLDHGLEIVAYALRLRQSHLLPAGASPEDQAAQSEVWTAATAYAALLHDIGKIAVDIHVELMDDSIWHPWHGTLQQPYRFRYREGRAYRLHSAATGLLYHQLLDRHILDWLCDYPDLWASLLYVLAGQYEHAGILAELVIQADRASVAQALGGDPARALAAPKSALQRKLLDGLRYLLKHELKLNQPQASDGWLTDDALWLVSKTVSDKLRAHLLAQGIAGIPANNTAVFNVLQEHGMLQPTPEGKAIWKATITSDTGWSHSFTLLRLAPALIWEASERPTPFAGTVAIESATDEADSMDTPALSKAPESASAPVAQPTAPESASSMPAATSAAGAMDELFSLLEQSQALEPEPPAQPATLPALANVQQPSPKSESAPTATATQPDAHAAPSAEHFMRWLKHALTTRKLILNDAKALVHTVNDSVFLVSPGVFQRYAQEHPQTAAFAKQEGQQDWQWLQKRFEKLGLHRKQPNGLNIWICEVTGPRKSRRLHGYLLTSADALFDEVPLSNPYLALSQAK
ncbi:relaxase [Ventosimonas gracilis]|uniref:Relaxase n=1 Tax=Ventosimonas gracilis TaxID=1680762 RepID=A0A139SUX0_9GAMM|nr:MobH family relaxase [Ventosimonas gracilis]KXU38314.1 relaxase [Ventosimonas gracilis]